MASLKSVLVVETNYWQYICSNVQTSRIFSLTIQTWNSFLPVLSHQPPAFLSWVDRALPTSDLSQRKASCGGSCWWLASSVHLDSGTEKVHHFQPRHQISQKVHCQIGFVECPSSYEDKDFLRRYHISGNALYLSLIKYWMCLGLWTESPKRK